jgi:hypothetical protein
MSIAITTEHGTTDDGRLIYSAEEHAKLEQATDRMDEEQFADWADAEHQGRIRGADGDAKSSAPKQWSRSDWETAAKRTHRMSADEYSDWESAPDEDRITH